MVGSDSPNELDIPSIDLVAFVENYDAILLVMGVFAAIAAYISQFAPEIGTSTGAELMYATGVVSALGITVLFQLLIYNKLASKAGSWYKLYLAHNRLDNLPLAFFTFFNLMLVLSIWFFATQYQPVIFILVFLATMFVGLGVFLRLVHKIGELVPQSVWIRSSVLFVLSLIIVIASDLIFDVYFAGNEISTIHELSFSNPVPIAVSVAHLLTVTIRGVAVLIIIVLLLFIPVIALKNYILRIYPDNTE